MSKIIHLRHEQIDKNRWDLTISSSINRSIYGMSWYLDIVSPGWEALIEDDYKNIMPLPVNHKYGLKYLIQPILCQQLGLYSQLKNNDVTPFLKIIQRKFLFSIINQNNIETKFQKINQILHLNDNYSIIKKNYSNQCSRKIKKGLSEQFQIIDNVGCNDFVDFYFKSIRFKHSNKMYSIVNKIVDKSAEFNHGFISGIYNNNELISAAFWLKSFNKFILLLPVSSPKGLETNSMYYLVDHFIRNNSSTNTILDFEGSNISGVNSFNKGFGAVEEYYYTNFISRLTFMELFFKKYI